MADDSGHKSKLRINFDVCDVELRSLIRELNRRYAYLKDTDYQRRAVRARLQHAIIAAIPGLLLRLDLDTLIDEERD